MSAPAVTRDLVLLYDGHCALCNGTVRFILARDRQGTMRFAPLGGEYAAAVRAEHPELAEVDSTVLVERAPVGGSSVRVRSDAALEVARYLGGPWRALALVRFVPRPLRDLGYRLVASLRHRILGGYARPSVVRPGDQGRFLP